MTPNGPAIWGGCVPAFSSKKRDGALFAVQIQILLSITRVAPAPLLQIKSGGTSLIGAVNLSPVTNLVAGTGAVSRYKLSRSQKLVKVQEFNCGADARFDSRSFSEGWCPGAKTITNLSCEQEQKQKPSRFFNKKAGNNLPILSVLWLVVIVLISVTTSDFKSELSKFFYREMKLWILFIIS